MTLKIEDACNSSGDSISRAFESQRSVIVVHIACRWTVDVSAIGKGTFLAFKVIKTISFAVSVLALPFRYGITLGSEKKTTHLASDLCQFIRFPCIKSPEAWPSKLKKKWKKRKTRKFGLWNRSNELIRFILSWWSMRLPSNCVSTKLVPHLDCYH